MIHRSEACSNLVQLEQDAMLSDICHSIPKSHKKQHIGKETSRPSDTSHALRTFMYQLPSLNTRNKPKIILHCQSVFKAKRMKRQSAIHHRFADPTTC